MRYSGSIYNRWNYDDSRGKYLRFADTADDFNGLNEQYGQATDRLNDQPVAFDNVVVLFVNNEYYNVTPEVLDIQLEGSGTAYAFRDGQVYPVSWQRGANDVVSLVNADGTPFAFKPGSTWFEVVGLQSVLQQSESDWRFTNKMP